MGEHLGEFEQMLLFAVLRLGDDAYGVTIRREIERRTGRRPSPGAIYTTLERLEQRGMVGSRVGGATPVRGGRRKRFYHLEPAGARALAMAYERLQRMAAGVLPRLQDLSGA
ncbi:MAG: helix-turn-helix transcriptional regulator [Candidatus Palauibacterales bacterium]|nr:helix-turn-helix transcriptional regulator [Candidatus Palauibacterales bacterium]MDP2482712.1 helix-turn-helix transcriptional regulator [Candidatus Palauibacterales bacterium]